jgi:hypothetical protein
VKQASAHFDEVTQYYGRVASKLAALNVEGLPGGLGLLSSFQAKLSDFTKLIQLPPQDRRLLRGGIVETPSAAYLPVAPGDALTVNAQVRQWMGEGVDLRFCIVRPDFVPHALEEAQHMERISLTQGLDNPQAKPQVDVLVPNGEIIKTAHGEFWRGLRGSSATVPGAQSGATSLNDNQCRACSLAQPPGRSNHSRTSNRRWGILSGRRFYCAKGNSDPGIDGYVDGTRQFAFDESCPSKHCRQ